MLSFFKARGPLYRMKEPPQKYTKALELSTNPLFSRTFTFLHFLHIPYTFLSFLLTQSYDKKIVGILSVKRSEILLEKRIVNLVVLSPF